MPLPDDVSVPTTTEEYFDYSSVRGFGAAYLAQYYKDRPVTNDERVVMNFFLPRLQSRPRMRRYLEIGCGPTLHHALMVEPYVDEVHLSDFLPDNREAVDKWINKSKDALNWSAYTRYILEVEGKSTNEVDILAREGALRRKISQVASANLMEEPVVVCGANYDAVGCFYCLEEVARTADSFAIIIGRVAKCIRDGGSLLIAALERTNFYHVQGGHGESVAYPCFALTKNIVQEALESAGLRLPETDIATMTVDGQAEEGVPGVILAFAEKA